MTNIQKHALSAAAVIAILAAAFFLYTNVFVDSASQAYVPEVQTRTEAASSTALFFITVGNEVTFESNEITKKAAQEKCEETAFDTNNMWKQVVCTFEKEVLYDDVFIAG